MAGDEEKRERLTEAVLRLGNILTGLLPDARDFGVTRQRLRLLHLLARGPSRPTDLAAEALGVDTSVITRLCDALVDGGLVTREHRGLPARPGASGDRRAATIARSPKGLQLLEQLPDVNTKALMPLLEAVPPSRRKGLLEAMKSFAEGAGEKD